MARRFSSSDSESAASGAFNGRSISGMPWWVGAFGVIAVVLVLLMVALHLTGHGPGGHLHGPATYAIEHGARSP